MSERLGRTISSTFMVSVDKYFDAFATNLRGYPTNEDKIAIPCTFFDIQSKVNVTVNT